MDGVETEIGKQTNDVEAGGWYVSPIRFPLIQTEHTHTHAQTTVLMEKRCFEWKISVCFGSLLSYKLPAKHKRSMDISLSHSTCGVFTYFLFRSVVGSGWDFCRCWEKKNLWNPWPWLHPVSVWLFDVECLRFTVSENVRSAQHTTTRSSLPCNNSKCECLLFTRCSNGRVVVLVLAVYSKLYYCGYGYIMCVAWVRAGELWVKFGCASHHPRWVELNWDEWCWVIVASTLHSVNHLVQLKRWHASSNITVHSNPGVDTNEFLKFKKAHIVRIGTTNETKK